MTQIDTARRGRISREMRVIARKESVEPEFIRKGVENGSIVIPNNRKRRLDKPCGIGAGLTTKINANIGTSKDSSDIRHELKKMAAAISLGADAIMDLSTGKGISRTRRSILARCDVPLGTVPLYEITIGQDARRKEIPDITIDEMFAVLEKQAEDGVDFFTIHAGVTQRAIDTLRDNPRILDIVSRGGAFLAHWITKNRRENPFYEYFDRVLKIAKEFDITLSLGDGLRPGSIKDATDTPQILELMALGELRKKAMRRGVQVMIEGPGHVPINQIETNVALEKAICGGAPFYVLGPLVTDVAPGYDHITAAIGGAIAATAGADFLCYVTPAEHLRLPTLEDVCKGVVATKIAAHAADVAKGIKGAIDWDIKISKARQARDWNEQFRLAIDSSKPKSYRSSSRPGMTDVCTMCGEFCSMKIAQDCLRKR